MARALRSALSLYLRSSNSIASHGASPFSTAVAVGNHTLKWMSKMDKKSPMEYINEVPPIPVEGRVVACIGGHDPALGHPVEYICLDSDAPNVCKYCGLRYVQPHHDHH
ncbi:hypothetical protein KP509_06G072600 [Ceratopteris richardii]|uniref:Zinc finger CHCC-type domain-containing protein n=1 Tax=Ceratopteris richardii TaxID=49495 RepID=A0A8T2UHE4_CERRI|nr:hypothetical protein KP509_06G072600 [Ceratopteris richardii]